MGIYLCVLPSMQKEVSKALEAVLFGEPEEEGERFYN